MEEYNRYFKNDSDDDYCDNDYGGESPESTESMNQVNQPNKYFDESAATSKL